MRAIERIAVVGGGPAGSTCARALASGGKQVTLFEANLRGEKACGGGVPSSALFEFPELGELSLPRRVVREVHVHGPAGEPFMVPLSGGVHIFSRRRLDPYLRERARQAGATIRQAAVRSVRRLAGGGWELATEDGPEGPFDYLVGADGVRGVVRRAVAGPWPDRDLTLALYAYRPREDPSPLVLKFTGSFDGYLWSFPRTDHVSIGVCAVHRTMSRNRLEENLLVFAEALGLGAGLDRRELRGYFIPATPLPPRGREGDRWALIGDAGGFVDPLTREGIAPAMRSGRALARSILLGRSPATPALPRDLRLAHRYRRGFFTRGFLDALVRLATDSRAIRRVLADLLEGRQGYRGLKPRLVLNALPCGLDLAAGVARGFRRRVQPPEADSQRVSPSQ